jgi:hypothetical protein
MGALKFLTADGLFRGQSADFFAFMTRLAREADAAGHQMWSETWTPVRGSRATRASGIGSPLTFVGRSRGLASTGSRHGRHVQRFLSAPQMDPDVPLARLTRAPSVSRQCYQCTARVDDVHAHSNRSPTFRPRRNPRGRRPRARTRHRDGSRAHRLLRPRTSPASPRRWTRGVRIGPRPPRPDAHELASRLNTTSATGSHTSPT